MIFFFVATVAAFHTAPGRMTVRSGASALQMGSALDIMRFKAVYRLTFKKTYAAVADAGLVDELNGGDFTILAPTDEAMEAFQDAGGVADAALLKLHVIPGKITGEELKGMSEVKTLGGVVKFNNVEDSKNDAGTSLGDGAFWCGVVDTDEAKFKTFDIEADNGLIHPIDTVLQP